jgi:leucyl-tRNA synthetase
MVIKDGAKMSKSIGNVVDPSEIVDKYGSDTARLFILFTSLPEKELEWSDQGVEGSFRFLNRAYKLVEEMPRFSTSKTLNNKDKLVLSKMNKTVKKVTELIEEFKLSLAIGSIMEFVNDIYKYRDYEVNGKVHEETLLCLSKLLSPFTPHLAEEMWEKLGKKRFISTEDWPKCDESKIDLKAEVCEEVISNTINDINYVLALTKLAKPTKITLFVADKWKYDYLKLLKEKLEETHDLSEIFKHVMAGSLKAYGKDISLLTPKLVKDSSRIPALVLDQDTEFKVLDDAIKEIGEKFGCEIEIIRAEESKEAKAKQAMPSKPAIIID